MKRALLAVALLACLAACSATDADSGSGAGGSSTKGFTSDEKKTDGKKAAAKKSTVDACALLEKDEIEGYIGANDGGHKDGGVGESVCAWENQDNYHSVTLSIGHEKTAADGKVPDLDVPGAGKPEAGPDGITFQAGMALFVIGTRACSVQVVTDPTSNKDRTAEARLVKLVRARLK